MPTPIYMSPDRAKGAGFEFFHQNRTPHKTLTPERRLKFLRMFVALLDQRPPRQIQHDFKENASTVAYAVSVVQRELIARCPELNEKTKACNTPYRLFHAPQLWRPYFDQHLRSELA